MIVVHLVTEKKIDHHPVTEKMLHHEVLREDDLKYTIKLSYRIHISSNLFEFREIFRILDL